MTIDGTETLFYTLAFLVPGFIMHLVISASVPQKSEEKEVSFLRFLALSSVNYAIWSWAVYVMFQSSYSLILPWKAALVWFIIVLISPLLLGFGFAQLSRQGTLRKVLRRLGFEISHPIPTAWDYKFSITTKPAWVIVTLLDGSKVAGLFGSKSFASSESVERDLFIQRVYKISPDGPWQPIPESDGIWTKADEVKYIEFRQ